MNCKTKYPFELIAFEHKYDWFNWGEAVLLKCSLMEVVLIVIVFVQLLSDVQAIKNDTFVSTNDSHQREFLGGSKLNDNKRFKLIEEYILKQLSFPYQFPINSTCKLHSDMVVEEANKLSIWALKSKYEIFINLDFK